jgi:hypothetical protein
VSVKTEDTVDVTPPSTGNKTVDKWLAGELDFFATAYWPMGRDELSALESQKKLYLQAKTTKAFLKSVNDVEKKYAKELEVGETDIQATVSRLEELRALLKASPKDQVLYLEVLYRSAQKTAHELFQKRHKWWALFEIAQLAWKAVEGKKNQLKDQIEEAKGELWRDQHDASSKHMSAYDNELRARAAWQQAVKATEEAKQVN